MEKKSLIDEIRSSLDAKNYESASRLLEHASETRPNSILIQLLRGKLLEDTAPIEEARAHYYQIVREHPQGFQAAPKLIKLLVKEGKTDEARDVFCSAVITQDEISEKQKIQLLLILTSLSTSPNVSIPFLEKLEFQGQLEGSRLIRLAEFYAVRGNDKQALAACRQADSLAFSTERSKVIELKSLFNLGQLEESYSLAQQLFEAFPSNRDFGFTLATLTKLCGKAESVAKLYKQLLITFPKDGTLLATIGSSPLKEVEFNRLYSLAYHNRRQGLYSNNALLQYIYFCLRAGDIDEGKQVLMDLVQTEENQKIAQLYLDALSSELYSASRERARIPFSPDTHIISVKTPGARATVFCFTTFFHRINAFPSAFTDSILASFPVNVVYLADTSYRLGLNGISDLGRSPEETAEKLKDMAKALGSEHIFTLGSSSGGFTAMLYGALMGAKAVISLAGQNTLELDQSSPRAVIKKRTTLSYLTNASTDLRPLIAAAKDTHFACYYGDACSPDVYQASRLRDLENTTTTAIENCSIHSVGLHMAAQEMLVPALEKAFSLRPS